MPFIDVSVRKDYSCLGVGLDELWSKANRRDVRNSLRIRRTLVVIVPEVIRNLLDNAQGGDRTLLDQTSYPCLQIWLALRLATSHNPSGFLRLPNSRGMFCGNPIVLRQDARLGRESAWQASIAGLPLTICSCPAQSQG